MSTEIKEASCMGAREELLFALDADAAHGAAELQAAVRPYETAEGLADAIGELIFVRTLVPQDYALTALRITATLLEYLRRES